MWTLAAGFESITNGAVYTEVNGVLDQSLTLDASSRIAMPGPWQLIAAHAMGANLQAARVNAPSLRSFILPEIYPVVVGAAITANTGPIVWGSRGPRFANQEYVIVEVSRAGASAQPVFWGMFIGPDVSPAATGPIFTATASATVTIVQGSWVLAALTVNQTLPAGRYQVVGMAVVCTGGVYARLVFPGLSQFRPGVVVQATYGDFPWSQQFRNGGMGNWGEFVHNAPPSIEFCGVTAATVTASVYLDLVKVG